MSGSIDYSLLFQDVGGSSASSATTNLLNIVYGTGTQATGTADPIPALKQAEANQTQDIAQTAQQPQVARDIAAFKAAVASAKTPADLLNNPTALKVILTANGLGSQVAYSALAQKALLSDPSQSNSLANQLSTSNSAWLNTASLYNFATKGLSVISSPQVQTTIANAYAEVLWRQSLDATTPGLSNALTFKSEASTITSAVQILGDPIMRTVVTTALNIPAQIAFQPLEAQEKAISSAVDVTRFKDPAFVESFTQQYLLAEQAASSSSSLSSTPDINALAVRAQGLVV
jgi:hypothetical protein